MGYTPRREGEYEGPVDVMGGAHRSHRWVAIHIDHPGAEGLYVINMTPESAANLGRALTKAAGEVASWPTDDSVTECFDEDDAPIVARATYCIR